MGVQKMSHQYLNKKCLSLSSPWMIFFFFLKLLQEVKRLPNYHAREPHSHYQPKWTHTPRHFHPLPGPRKRKKEAKKPNQPSTQRGVSEVWNAPLLFEDKIYTWHPPLSSLLRLACVQINRRLAAAGTSSYNNHIIQDKCARNCYHFEVKKKPGVWGRGQGGGQKWNLWCR